MGVGFASDADVGKVQQFVVVAFENQRHDGGSGEREDCEKTAQHGSEHAC